MQIKNSEQSHKKFAVTKSPYYCLLSKQIQRKGKKIAHASKLKTNGIYIYQKFSKDTIELSWYKIEKMLDRTYCFFFIVIILLLPY